MENRDLLGHSGARRMRRPISRRSFIKAGVALGAAGGIGTLQPRHARLIDAALASAQSTSGSLADIEHVVILMQENRSFDHYFGTLSGVRGFADRAVPVQSVGSVASSVFHQYGPAGYSVGGDPFLDPFELRSSFPSQPGQTTNDITHDWGPQHFSWNDGAMDKFLQAHLAVDGTTNGFLTMGYFTRDDLPFYHALADAFTICDGYHCSVLGPTYPNRLMQMSASLGADGKQGGPVLVTYNDPPAYYGTLDWMTYPEALTEGGVSWKVYQDPTSMGLFSVLPFFKNFSTPSTPADFENVANGLAPQYPVEFLADVAAGTLPQVSWIMPPAACCEHPAAPPEYGEWLVSEVLSTLVSNPDVWAKTVFFVIYDENGGFFDHVPPPTPGPMALSPQAVPASDYYAGEYITAPLPSAGTYAEDGKSLQIYGPVGLGFRTPALVLSPFSRGGYVCSDVFDHISVLKFIEKRFGVAIPNVSPWRYDTVGDMTTALALAVAPNTQVPSLPATSLADPEVAEQAVVDAILGTVDYAPLVYPPPTSNAGVPDQETTPTRVRLPFPAAAAASTPPRAGTAAGDGGGASGITRSVLAGRSSSGGRGAVTARPGTNTTAVSPILGDRRRAERALAKVGDDTGLVAALSAAGAATLAGAGVLLRRMTGRAVPAPRGPSAELTGPGSPSADSPSELG